MKARTLALFLAATAFSAHVRGEEVTVFAAVSLTEALQQVGRLYEARGADTVAFHFGASNDLARQIREGAPADVFFSADAAQMDRLEEAGLVTANSRTNVLSNVLVAVVPADSRAEIRGASDLLGVGRIALADPEAVPAGIYARTYLESAGLWTRVKEKVIPTLNVRAALAAVESGNVDVGFVYRTDAAVSRRARVAFEVPAEGGPRIVYPVAPIASSRKAGLAAFTRFLVSPEALKVYAAQGFLVIAPSPAP
jgi:molybdate transport system substrate-binding protein